MTARPLVVAHVAPFAPFQPDTGGRVRLSETYALLHDDGDVRGLYLEADPDRAAAARAALPGQEVLVARGGSRFRSARSRSADRLLRTAQLAGLRCGLPLTDQFRECSRDVTARVRELASGADVTLVEFAQLAPCRPPGPAVFVAHDLNWMKLERRAEARERAGTTRDALEVRRLRAEARCLRRTEARLLARYDAVVAMSELDRGRLLEAWRELRIAGPRIVVSPNGAAVSRFAGVGPPASPGTAAFLGALSHPPNLDAVELLVGEILPATGPSLRRLVLAGEGTERYRGARLDGLGRVADVRTVLQAATITVAPIRWGSGTRIKILESLAAARPVVAFPEAAEGLDDLVASGAVVVVDDVAAFAAESARLLADPELSRRLGERGREAAAAYDWRATLRPLVEALHTAARGPA